MESIDLYPGERVWFSRPRAIEGLEVLHARQSPRLWRHWHETYTLCVTYPSEGCGSFRYRNRDLTIGPCEVMLMEPGELHVTRRIEGGRGIADFDVFFLQPSLVEDVARDLGLHGPFHLTHARSNDPQLCAAVEELARGLDRDDSLTQQQRLVAVLWFVLSRCAEERAGQPKEVSKVQVTRVRDFFEAHYADSFDLERLAQECRVSKSSICHGLPRWLGVTPRELQTLVRVRRAKELLALGVTASDVASQTGFADQPQLTRHFGRHFGVTPAKYARMVGAR